MSIITEQNILGDSSLAGETRPGTSGSVAHYAFSNRNYEMQMYDMMDSAKGGSWVVPASYAPTVDMAEATGEASTPQIGPAGEDELSSPTEYGTQGHGALSENAAQTTALEQVAEVIAGTADAVVPIVPMSSAIRSETIRVDGEQGPESSGGDFDGYEFTNQYYQNPATEEITQRAPIEDTGIKSVFDSSLSELDGLGAKAASLDGGMSLSASTISGQSAKKNQSSSKMDFD